MNKKLLLLLSSLFLLFACGKDNEPKTSVDKLFKESSWVGALTFEEIGKTYQVSIVFDLNGNAVIDTDREHSFSGSLFRDVKVQIGEKSLKWIGLEKNNLFSGVWFFKDVNDKQVLLVVDQGSIDHRELLLNRVN